MGDWKLILLNGGLLAGIVSLLFFVARLIFSGRYYPGSWVKEQREHYNEQIAREREISENYRLGLEKAFTALDKQGEQLEKVIEGQIFVKDFVVGLKSAMDTENQRRSLPGRRQ